MSKKAKFKCIIGSIEELPTLIGKPDENGCQEWLGSIRSRCPVFALRFAQGERTATLQFPVRRHLWAVAHGPVATTDAIFETCNNRRCVALEHLKCARSGSWGTHKVQSKVVESQKDNTDMKKKIAEVRANLIKLQDQLTTANSPGEGEAEYPELNARARSLYLRSMAQLGDAELNLLKLHRIL